MEGEAKFIDAESYMGGGDQQKITFQDIVLSHIKKISTFSSVEFRGGYTLTKVVPMQGGVNKVTEEYIEDSREVYSNAIEYLYDLLFPHFDKEMKKNGKDLEEEEEKILKDYLKDGIFTDEEKLEFRQKRRKIYRRMFRELSCFLKRVDYFKGKVFEEEV